MEDKSSPEKMEALWQSVKGPLTLHTTDRQTISVCQTSLDQKLSCDNIAGFAKFSIYGTIFCQR